MTTYPVLPVAVPPAVAMAHNGQLAPQLLRTIGTNGGQLERSVAARCWFALYVSMAAAGFTGADALTYTPGGTYRTLNQQTQLFMQRWQIAPEAPANLSDPAIIQHWHDAAGHRFYSGAWWVLRPGVARAAVPGTSNHGVGLACDTALGATPSTARSIASTCANGRTGLSWLLAPAPAAYGAVCNAVSLGWSWESQAEPWHLHLCSRTIPRRVADVEHYLQTA
jgi:hypothetical protein